MLELLERVIAKNGLIFAFLVVGLLLYAALWLARAVLRGKIPGVALAIVAGLGLALFGGRKGLADISLFAGLALLGGSMLRDFTVVATAMGADLKKIRYAGPAGLVALVAGVIS